MTTLLVADVGNSRLKWGRCDAERVLDAAALPLDDPAAWERQLAAWPADALRAWVVTGVSPPHVERFAAWLRMRGEAVRVLDGYGQLPLVVAVDHPETVGIDRLLNAVAANARPRGGRPAVLVDAGSAVTVDWVDGAGVFRGGAIVPGLRLMAQALHRYTARLPLVAVTSPCPPMPGRSTVPAIAAGVYGAVAGGISYLTRQLAAGSAEPPLVFVTGGDADLLAPALEPPFELWPHMTLEGVRLAAAGVR